MDLHISVIADFKNIFPDIDITDWSLSGHTWVFKTHKHNHKHINESTWINITINMIKQFQTEYDGFLQSFDGFICGHPNGFIPIYEKYNKPIIMINTCRYDLPYCISKNYEMLKFYNDCIKRIHEKGLLIAVSNNKADQKYTLLGCNILTKHIPSLCAYTGIRYNPTRTTFLCYTGNLPNHPLITKRSELGSSFQWSDIGNFKGIIHIPYEISTMSMFEHYSAGIPLFFPSKQLMLEKYNVTSISEYWGKHLPSEYNQMSTQSAWIDMADYYNVFNTPNIYYFDSFEHLIILLETFIWKDDTLLIKEYTENIRTSWSSLLKPYISNNSNT